MTTLEAFFYQLFGRPELQGYLPYLEIRVIAPKWYKTKSHVRASSRWARTIDEALEIVSNLKGSSEPYNLFFGVLPRAVRRGIHENVKQAATIWVDVDAKDVGSKESAFDLIDNFSRSNGTEPTCLVDTGNGAHAYWCLEAPSVDVSSVVASNRRIASKCGGDNAHDAPRVLRIPTTINWKDPNNPLVCNLISLTPNTHTLDKFIPQSLNAINTTTINYPQSRATRMVSPRIFEPVDFSLEDLRRRLGPLWSRYMERGIEADKYGYYRKSDGSPDKSRLDFAFVKEMLKRGYTENQIYTVMTNPQFAISEKTLEKQFSAQRYLQLTIEKARDYV